MDDSVELAECRSRLATLQSSRDNLAEEYEELYDSHQTMFITLQDAEVRQDEDAKLILTRTRQCKELQEKHARSCMRIQDLEVALADALSDRTNWPMSLRVTVESVVWWKEKCRVCHLEKKQLESRLALFSDEVCPMQCDRMYTHSMRCCGSKICGTCLGKWRVESDSCPYCRAPLSAHALPLNRLGSAQNPIGLD